MEKYILKAITSIGILLFTASSTFAAQSIYLQPSSGNITTGGSIVRIYYNSDGNSAAGASVRVTYSDNLTLESATGASVCGTDFTASEGSGYVDISCLFSSSQVFSGSIATLTFSADATGETATLTLSDPDPSSATTSNGTYTTIEGSADDDLPDTAISEPITILIGLMLIGFGFAMYKYQIARLNIEDDIVEYTGSLKDKVQGKR